MKSTTYQQFHISFLLSVPAVSRRPFALRSQSRKSNCWGILLLPRPSAFRVRPRSHCSFRPPAIPRTPKCGQRATRLGKICSATLQAGGNLDGALTGSEHDPTAPAAKTVRRLRLAIAGSAIRRRALFASIRSHFAFRRRSGNPEAVTGLQPKGMRIRPRVQVVGTAGGRLRKLWPDRKTLTRAPEVGADGAASRYFWEWRSGQKRKLGRLSDSSVTNDRSLVDAFVAARPIFPTGLDARFIPHDSSEAASSPFRNANLNGYDAVSLAWGTACGGGNFSVFWVGQRRRLGHLQRVRSSGAPFDTSACSSGWPPGRTTRVPQKFCVRSGHRCRTPVGPRAKTFAST